MTKLNLVLRTHENDKEVALSSFSRKNICIKEKFQNQMLLQLLGLD